MPKFGEFSSARLKPTWEDTSKPAKDATGWKRGQVQKWTDGESEFMRTADPKADDFMYGRRGDRPNGQQVVMTKSGDPGTFTNDSDKGYRGVDE
jgi:hypothetical protein